MTVVRGVTLNLFLVCAVGGCAANSNLQPEQKLLLDRALAFPTDFTVDRKDAGDAWGRAQSFVGRFSSMKLQTASDFVIQTYNPGDGDVAYGYNVTKTPAGDDVQFDVRCGSGNMFAVGEASKNAHILAYYMKTGELADFGIAR